jgi:hypothetical protein
MKQSLLTSVLGLMGAVPLLATNIIITEVMYNAAGYDDGDEWVEIYNLGDTTIDLTGWKLRDEDTNAVNWGTLSGSLAPGQVGVITLFTENGFKAAWSTAANATIFTTTGWGSLANTVTGAGNEVIRLYDASDNLIDEVDYLTVAPWPLEAATNGLSIYLLPGFFTAELNDDGANWAVSSLGVHGAINPVSVTDTERTALNANDNRAFGTGNVGSPGIVVVPEPTTYALLLGLGALGLLIARRRR